MAGGFLERELESIIEKEEQEALAEARSKRPRRDAAMLSSASQDVAPCTAASGKRPIESVHEGLTKQIKLAHVAACNREDSLEAHRTRCAEELQLCQQVAQEATAAYTRAELAVPSCEQQVREAEEHLGWLEDIYRPCESAKAKAVFKPWVMAEFSKTVDQLSTTIKLQRDLVKEAQAALKQSQAVHEGSRRDCEAQLRRAEQAGEALRRAEEDLAAARTEVVHIQQQNEWAWGMLKQVQELSAVAKRTEAASQEAERQRDRAQAKFSEHSTWSGDLKAFFEGQKVRDSHAIVAGLQSVMPSGEPLPVIVQALLADPGVVTRGNATIISVQAMAAEPMRKAEETLRKHLVDAQTKFLESQNAHAQATQQMRQLEEQLQHALETSRPAAPRRPSKAPPPQAVATPLKCQEARQEIQNRQRFGNARY